MPGPWPYAPIQYPEQQTLLFPGQTPIGIRSIWDVRSRVPLDFATGTNKGAVSFFMGAAIARDPSGSGFILANNANIATAAIGLACLGAPATQPEIVQLHGVFTLDDWTPVIGATSLTALAYYWLAAINGQLTTVKPVGPAIAELVGIPISPKSLFISPVHPV